MGFSPGQVSDTGVLAAPLSIDGVGPDGLLPPEASISGAILRIPVWPNPSIEPGNGDLIEIMVLEPGAPEESEKVFHSERLPVPVIVPAFFRLDAQYLQREGNIRLRYRVTSEDTENTDTSLPQWFTVRRLIPVNLAEPQFPSATLWGYLNCQSVPKLWETVIIKVPAQPGRFSQDDVCTLDWQGFASLNGVGAIEGTAGRFTKTLTLAEAGSADGFTFELRSEHYDQYIRPMEKNASAVASYTLYRNGIGLGRSVSGLVKIDRVIPGGSGFCGP